MKKEITKIHYSNSKNIFLLLPLWFLSLFYGLFIKTKNFLYDKKILKGKSYKPFIICVGNLTTGGVGKSPVVIEIANYLSAQNKKVAIVSRGYGGKLNKKNVNLVRDFNGILIDNPTLVGDEPCMIAKSIQNCAVVTSYKRGDAIRFAENLGAEYIIMDDGFSNRTINKDLTLLLIDKEKQFGNSKLLPLGPLREPVSEVKRCNKIIAVSKNPTNKTLPDFNKEIIECTFNTDKFYDINSHDTILPDKNKKVVALCAIGQPEHFFNYIKSNFDLYKTFAFEDHHAYTLDDFKDIVKLGYPIITTQKDEIKILNLLENIKTEIYVLKLKANVNISEIF